MILVERFKAESFLELMEQTKSAVFLSNGKAYGVVIIMIEGTHMEQA